MSGANRHITLIFDLDGTIVDSLPGITSSIQCAVQGYNCSVSPEKVRKLIGPPVRHVLRMILGDVSATALDRVEQTFRTAYDSTGWKESKLFPKGFFVLRTLYDAGFQLFVFTNKPQRATMQILSELGVHRFFKATLSKDSRVPAYESKAEMLETLISQHELEKTTCFVIGDSDEDFQAARKLQVPFVFATYGYGQMSEEDLEEDVGLIESLSGLLKFCKDGIANDR
jgi:phosphoglycolate phosphatase